MKRYPKENEKADAVEIHFSIFNCSADYQCHRNRCFRYNMGVTFWLFRNGRNAFIRQVSFVYYSRRRSAVMLPYPLIVFIIPNIDRKVYNLLNILSEFCLFVVAIVAQFSQKSTEKIIA